MFNNKKISKIKHMNNIHNYKYAINRKKAN